jgi:AcrR family transcriptional regulator
VGPARRAVVDEQVKFVEHSAARTRILDAALELFAKHGVSATSLQMIADAIGVTKAAVYHQFPAKDQIVLAVTERELSRLLPALEQAEARCDGVQARDELLVLVIDMAVRDRRLASALQFDPVMINLLGEHEPFQRFMARLYGVLLGDSGEDARVEAAMLAGAIGSAVMNPLVADIDDDTLRTRLTDLSRRLLGLPEKGRRTR